MELPTYEAAMADASRSTFDPPRPPVSRDDFEIAIICALTLEADAVDGLFDHCWDDDGIVFGKQKSDPNAYSTGVIGCHNVVLAHMPGMGKVYATAVAAHCRSSFPNIKLAIVVGVCGVVPFYQDDDQNRREIVLGDVIVSSGVVQYDLGKQSPELFIRKDTLLDSLGRPNTEIRALLAKLQSRRGRRRMQNLVARYMDVLRSEQDLRAGYPGATHDRLFPANYRHIADGKSCVECRCNGLVMNRQRLEQDSPAPDIHFGLMASGDAVMKSGVDRDRTASQEKILGFEMEGAGVWDTFPCVIVKGGCDYADSHKNDMWKRYAAATAAAGMKALLSEWKPSASG